MKLNMKTYEQFYAEAQAGGMNAGDSHDFAKDQSTRTAPAASRHTPELWNENSHATLGDFPLNDHRVLSGEDYERARACINALAGLNPEALANFVAVSRALLSRMENASKIETLQAFNCVSCYAKDFREALAALKGGAK